MSEEEREKEKEEVPKDTQTTRIQCELDLIDSPALVTRGYGRADEGCKSRVMLSLNPRSRRGRVRGGGGGVSGEEEGKGKGNRRDKNKGWRFMGP